MKVVYTTDAIEDLDGILAYIASNHPTVSEAFAERLKAVVARIGDWPNSAQDVADRPGVKVVPLFRYPYKVFYRTVGDAVEILHVHHTARGSSSSVD